MSRETAHHTASATCTRVVDREHKHFMIAAAAVAKRRDQGERLPLLFLSNDSCHHRAAHLTDSATGNRAAHQEHKHFMNVAATAAGRSDQGEPSYKLEGRTRYKQEQIRQW